MHNLRRIIIKHNNILNLAKLAAGTILLDNISSHREYIIKKKKEEEEASSSVGKYAGEDHYTDTVCVCKVCTVCDERRQVAIGWFSQGYCWTYISLRSSIIFIAAPNGRSPGGSRELLLLLLLLPQSLSFYFLPSFLTYFILYIFYNKYVGLKFIIIYFCLLFSTIVLLFKVFTLLSFLQTLLRHSVRLYGRGLSLAKQPDRFWQSFITRAARKYCQYN